MQRLRPILTVLVLASLVACTAGSASPPAPSASASGSVSAKAAKGLRGSGLARKARIMVGTAWQLGELVRWCERRDCEEARGVVPPAYLDLPESGVMLFAVGSRPREAHVEVRRRSGALVAGGPAPVETNSIPWRADLAPGRYVVTLVARWKTREARWVFGVREPTEAQRRRAEAAA